VNPREAIGAPRTGRWPSGDSRFVAMLALEPVQLAGRYGISFITWEADGLGPCEGAGVRLPSGRHLLLTRHEHQPEPGTFVEADWADDAREACRELLDALGLDERACTWMSDEPAPGPDETARFHDVARRSTMNRPAVPPLVLASQSPRRAELIGRLGLEFETLPADIDESYQEGETPPEHAERLSREKALKIAADRPEALVVGSDTIVVIDGDVLGKPRDREHAIEMLMRLSGREHEVCTGVAVAHGGRVESGLERVRVRFRTLDRSAAEEYVDTGEPMDKAGAYGIQGFGSAIVDGIDGDYFAVMGLPVVRMLSLIERHGWRYAFGRLRAV
jgi:septum formation protein